MIKNTLFTLLILPLVLSACGDTKLLGQKAPPDETMVIDGPPLTLPPDFEIRPPRDGSSTGEELLRRKKTTPTATDANDNWIIEQAGHADENIREALTPSPEPTAAEKSKERAWFGLWGKKDDMNK